MSKLLISHFILCNLNFGVLENNPQAVLAISFKWNRNLLFSFLKIILFDWMNSTFSLLCISNKAYAKFHDNQLNGQGVKAKLKFSL